MEKKQQLLKQLTDVFEQWDALLNPLSETQADVVLEGTDWSIKDEVAHLMAWQQISIARLEAAQQADEPQLPTWRTEPLAADDQPETDQFNQRIFTLYHDTPWAEVYLAWRHGFQRFLALGEAFPEDVLQEKNRYAWMQDYALVDVLNASLEHHLIDHLEPLLARLNTL